MAEGYTVRSQRETTRWDGSHFSDGMEIAVLSAGGVPFSVFVPMAQFNVDAVNAAILDRLQHIDAVQNL